MCELADGTLIFGNIDGALVYNGAHLQKVMLPNNSSVTSLLETQKGEIYVGGYNQFGTLQKNRFGEYFYKSLTPKFQLVATDFKSIININE